MTPIRRYTPRSRLPVWMRCKPQYRGRWRPLRGKQYVAGKLAEWIAGVEAWK